MPAIVFVPESVTAEKVAKLRKWGAEVRPEAEVRDIRPLPPGQPDGARYEVLYRRSTAWRKGLVRGVRARNVVVSAGTLGTLRLLFRCREITRSLPLLSQRLGDGMRGGL